MDARGRTPRGPVPIVSLSSPRAVSSGPGGRCLCEFTAFLSELLLMQ